MYTVVDMTTGLVMNVFTKEEDVVIYKDED